MHMLCGQISHLWNPIKVCLQRRFFVISEGDVRMLFVWCDHVIWRWSLFSWGCGGGCVSNCRGKDEPPGSWLFLGEASNSCITLLLGSVLLFRYYTLMNRAGNSQIVSQFRSENGVRSQQRSDLHLGNSVLSQIGLKILRAQEQNLNMPILRIS